MISSRSRRCSAVSAGQSPIIEDQQPDAREALEHAGIAPVAAWQAEALQHARHALMEHRAIVATGSLAEGAGNPGLADAGRASDQQILLAFKPFALCKPLEQSTVETAVGTVVDILRSRDLTQTGEAQPCLQPLVIALQNLAIGQHRQTILEAKLCAVGLSRLFFERVEHADQAKLA
jgi:hypothetical protein